MDGRFLHRLAGILDESNYILLYAFKHYYEPFLYVNRAVVEKSGYSRQELLTKVTPGQLVHPSVREEVYNNFLKRIRGEELPRAYEIPVVIRDGSVKWIYVGYTLVVDAGDPVIVALGFETTTEHETKRLLEAIFSTLPLSLLVVDESGSILLSNREEYIGRRCFEVVKGKDSPCSPCIARRAYRTGSVEYATFKVGDRWFRSSAAPIDELEDLSRALICVEDVTEERKAAEREKEMERLRAASLMARGMAHDFNNLLATIMGNISMAMMHCKSQEVERLLKSAEKACYTARRLLESVKSLSGDIELKLERLDLERVVEEALSTVFIPEDIRVVKDLAGADGYWIVADRDQIIRVLQNLITNAVDAMDRGGVLTIRAKPSPDGRMMAVSVSDTGRGIPEEILDKIFTPFFSTKMEGRGLGLFIVKKIVEKHGGSISVSSGKEGTTFTFTVPACRRESRDEERVGDASLAGKCIVVVDDNLQFANMIKLFLESRGAVVRLFRSADAVLEELEREKIVPHAFIVDVCLSYDGEGIDLVRKLAPRFPDAKFLLMSGYPERPDLDVKCVFLKKPFSLYELLRHLNGDK